MVITKYRCDVCGEVFDSFFQVNIVSLPTGRANVTCEGKPYGTLVVKEHHICYGCADKIVAAVDSIRKNYGES